jgi:hypothetical protein
VIAAAFTAITTKSSLDFTAEVNTRVQVDLSSSAEATMKYVIDLLEETVAYVNQKARMKSPTNRQTHQHKSDTTRMTNCHMLDGSLGGVKHAGPR